MAAPTCSIKARMSTLDRDDQRQILAVVYSAHSERKAAALLSAAGFPVAHSTIHNHRAGVCRTCNYAADLIWKAGEGDE